MLQCECQGFILEGGVGACDFESCDEVRVVADPARLADPTRFADPARFETASPDADGRLGAVTDGAGAAAAHSRDTDFRSPITFIKFSFRSPIYLPPQISVVNKVNNEDSKG
jgi:hypothetical protein